jgi:hypothetical protein
MRGVPLNQRIRRVLSVSLDAGNALQLDDTPSSFFPAHVAQPQGENSTSDISPRQGRATSTLWLGPRLPILLHPSDRIEVGETVYELLSAAREVTEGRSTVGYRAPVLPIAELYPRTAAVHPLGVDDPAGEIECSVFSLAHRNASRGEYDDSFGEAPVTALSVLEGVSGSNVELRFEGGERWKVRSFSLSREVPFVAMQLTKVG